MTRTTSRLALLLAAAALALGGCAGSSPTGGGGSTGGEASEPAPAESTPADDSGSSDGGAADLTVADSSLGEIVVDAEGMTVYMFDNDTQGSGTSTCEGQCLVNWPPVPPAGDEPVASGVEGELGTITATDGSTQITLNGWPLYYFKGDSAPGDVNGQAVQDIWWVLDPSGEVIRDTAG